MNILKQVCTKEQSIKLKELGVHQGSFFAYINEGQLLSRHSPNLDLMAIATDFTAAYTVAELGEMLPAGCQSNYNDHHGYWVCDWPEVWDEEDEPNARPYAVPGWKITAEIDDEEMQTEAQVRAAMLIHLIESKLLTIEEINKRM